MDREFRSALVMAWACAYLAIPAIGEDARDHQIEQARPIMLGTSGINANVCSSGTLGSLLRIGETRYILSNNHVLARENDATPGEPVIQPGWLDQTGKDRSRCVRGLGPPASDIVADLTSFIPLIFKGKPVWLQRWSSENPPSRYFAAMAYDSARKQVVLFGGIAPSPRQAWGDTWTWDGDRWTQQFPVGSPPPQASHAMAYDAARQNVVLFGLSGDTWTWDGANWQLRVPATRPSGRAYPAMAYDARRGEVVMFGGSIGNHKTAETWVWDGYNWSLRRPSRQPPARSAAAMAYDETRGEVVLFGGIGEPGGYPNDTWVWDGATWTERNPSTRPAGIYGHSMTYDPNTQKVLLTMMDYGSPPTFQTWSWDGSNWQLQNLPNAPPLRFGHAMATDSERREIVLYGGSWGLDPNPWRADTWVWTESNAVDAAIAKARPGQVSIDGEILDIGVVSSTPLPPYQGLKVKKSGRTTGLTKGEISAIHVDVDVKYSRGTAHFKDQVMIRGGWYGLVPFSLGGDSGSLVVEDVAVSPRPVGLLFAKSTASGIFGYTFASPMSAVLNAFSGAEVVGASPGTAQSADLGASSLQVAVERAATIKRRNKQLLFSTVGVVGTGIGLASDGTRGPVIEVYVDRSDPTLRRQLPTSLEGVPVEIIVTGPVVALSGLGESN